MAELYNKYHGFGEGQAWYKDNEKNEFVVDKKKLKEIKDANKEWNDLKVIANAIRDKGIEKSVKEREKKRKQQKEQPVTKTFVNSYGEATTREITSSTYKRQQKRLNKQIMSMLGK